MPGQRSMRLPLALVLGGAVLAQTTAFSSVPRTDAVPALSLAAYHAIQFDTARELQRRLISEHTRHDRAINRLRRAHRTSMTALRRRILELVADVSGAAPSHGVPNGGIRAANASPVVESTPKEDSLAAASAVSSPPTGGGELNRTRYQSMQEPSTGAGNTADGPGRSTDAPPRREPGRAVVLDGGAHGRAGEPDGCRHGALHDEPELCHLPRAVRDRGGRVVVCDGLPQAGSRCFRKSVCTGRHAC